VFVPAAIAFCAALTLAPRLGCAGRWEEVVGTCVVFEEDAAPAGATGGAAPRRVRHAGNTETRLVMRRAPLPPAPLLALPAPPAAALPQEAAQAPPQPDAA
jgi:hypothetical protein